MFKRRADQLDRSPAKAARCGIETVRQTAHSTTDQYLDLYSVANLRACSSTLHEQYSPETAPTLWRGLTLADPAATFLRKNMTRVGVEVIHRRFQFKLRDIRQVVGQLFHRASADGKLGVVQWYAEQFGAAGLLADNNIHGSVCVINVERTTARACRHGHIEFISWVFDLLGLEIDAPHRWQTMMREACKGGHTAMLDWIYQQRTPKMSTTPALRGARIGVVRHVQQDVIWSACRKQDVAVIEWAVKAFEYSRERINKIVAMDCLLFGIQGELVRHLVMDYGPLGRGPNAERIRHMFANPAYVAYYGALPAEPEYPEDSKYEPEPEDELLPISTDVETKSDFAVRTGIGLGSDDLDSDLDTVPNIDSDAE